MKNVLRVILFSLTVAAVAVGGFVDSAHAVGVKTGGSKGG